MRFSKVVPAGPDELKAAILDDPEALVAGLRVVAGAVPVPGRGAIDLLAADGRGRLAVICFALEAAHESIGEAVSRWDWVVTNLGAFRVLMPGSGLDLGVEPRLLLVASGATEGARRLAGLIARPEVELYQATLIATEQGRGLMIDRVRPAAPPPAGGAGGFDPVLAAVPAGEARSLMRRVLEEVRDSVQGSSLSAVSVPGAVDISLGERPLATLAATPAGLQARLIDADGTFAVEGDEGCREAAARIATAARETAGAPALDVTPERPAGEPPPARPIAGVLTPEEIAEFERFAPPAESRTPHPAEREPDARTSPRAAQQTAVASLRARFMEN